MFCSDSIHRIDLRKISDQCSIRYDVMHKRCDCNVEYSYTALSSIIYQITVEAKPTIEDFTFF